MSCRASSSTCGRRGARSALGSHAAAGARSRRACTWDGLRLWAWMGWGGWRTPAGPLQRGHSRHPRHPEARALSPPSPPLNSSVSSCCLGPPTPFKASPKLSSRGAPLCPLRPPYFLQGTACSSDMHVYIVLKLILYDTGRYSLTYLSIDCVRYGVSRTKNE